MLLRCSSALVKDSSQQLDKGSLSRETKERNGKIFRILVKDESGLH